VKNLLLPALFALSLTSCIAVVKAPPSNNNNPPPQEPVRDDPPPPPPPPVFQGPPVPAGVPVFHDRLKLEYDARVEYCYEAARKTLAIMKFTEADLDKKTGEITGVWGPVFARATMYRFRHHTYLTFYFRVHGQRADARMPQDMCRKSHDNVGKLVKEKGR